VRQKGSAVLQLRREQGAFVISTAAACGLIEARYEAVMPRMLKFGCE
jgi:hypothetical protein